ncbi:hypothetical protein C922_05653 [Plasmodium inui San Antonio 1]|uniref:Uncharacterized protein n=1 Tax=Plasmodium inui San Antonio 1 TaxID=1237626 RepID=W6ZSS0_9APIC|nr:hypothetical protein C922_05653 [Plasmodium inui San Antonio 1]EUD63967.1 hypothetical protein C922_05653 [Plasmodium inui San Antonio 1]
MSNGGYNYTKEENRILEPKYRAKPSKINRKRKIRTRTKSYNLNKGREQASPSTKWSSRTSIMRI